MHVDYARNYRKLWEGHWWWRSRERYLLRWISRLHARTTNPAGLRILDVGCGDGLFFDRLEPFGRVEGLEPDASIVSDSRWRNRIRVAPLDADVPESAFDLVLMLDTLEHIADDRAALDAARTTLKPGGHLLMTVPALRWLWSRHDEVNLHYRRYDRRGLGLLLGEAGFEVEELRYFFAWTVAPLLVRRWLAPANGQLQLAADDAVSIPFAPVNRFLTFASLAEHSFGLHVPLPLGSSLFALAKVRA